MSAYSDCFCCILKSLGDEFESELMAVSENREVNWSFAQNALRRLTCPAASGKSGVRLFFHDPEGPGSGLYMACAVSEAEEFWNIFELLMKSFGVFNVRDPTLPVELLCHAYNFAREDGHMDFAMTLEELFYVFPRKYLGTWCLCEREWCETGMLTDAQFRQLRKMPYNIPYPPIEDEIEQIHKHVVWCAIREGLEPLLSGFLKYGVMFLPAPNYSPDKIRYREALNQLLRLRKNYQPPEEFTWQEVDSFQGKKERRPFTILRVLELLALDLRWRKRRPEPDQPLQSKRPGLAEYAEDISSCKSVYFRCLRRAYETIPEPFISSNEVKKILRIAYDRIWDEELELCINEIIADFEELYPEGREPVAPRSLQHLSRCQVRENLRQSGALPCGIKELGINMKVQKYIALEE